MAVLTLLRPCPGLLASTRPHHTSSLQCLAQLPRSRASHPPHRSQARHVSLGPSSASSSTTSHRPPKSSHPAHNLDKNVTKEETEHYDTVLASSQKDFARRTPWHREAADKPPVAQARSAGAMTKGKLLTTPTRLFKLVLPLTTRDMNSDRKDVAPLALLVHPQQPLSYLERLIQSELPLLKEGEGREKIPAINFKAMDSMRDDEPPGSASEEDMEEAESEGKSSDSNTPTIPGEGNVESYSGLGRESKEEEPEDAKFVRWSKSTEIGDFVRDAARGKEFAVEIEGAPSEIRVGVPSFADRTYYLRMRLRKKSKEIAALADTKRECDRLAEISAQRVAYAGFAGMTGWGLVVYYLTFKTELGWDVMEPVTYLVGLAGLLGGYAWFLLNKRDVSYRSAMHLTVSRRQNQLYEKRGLDLKRWEWLIEEANALRREIIAVAQEYDVEYVEERDVEDEKAREELAKQRRKAKKAKSGGESDEAKDEDHAADSGSKEPKKWEGARG